MFKLLSIPQIFLRVLIPGLDILFIIFKPWLTIVLLRPIKGTTSHTVPKDTKSR